MSDRAKEDVDLDLLEATAIILEKSVWELFKEMCICHGIRNPRRIDALWQGWVSEDFIPQFMLDSLHQIMVKTTWS